MAVRSSMFACAAAFQVRRLRTSTVGRINQLAKDVGTPSLLLLAANRQEQIWGSSASESPRVPPDCSLQGSDTPDADVSVGPHVQVHSRDGPVGAGCADTLAEGPVDRGKLPMVCLLAQSMLSYCTAPVGFKLIDIHYMLHCSWSLLLVCGCPAACSNPSLQKTT